MDFERGKDPKESLEIGRDVKKKPGDRFMAWSGELNKSVEVIATSDELRHGEWITRKQDEHIERRMVDIKLVNGESSSYAYATSSDWRPGEWTVQI